MIGAIVAGRVSADFHQPQFLVDELGAHVTQHLGADRAGLGAGVVVTGERHELDVEVSVVEALRLASADRPLIADPNKMVAEYASVILVGTIRADGQQLSVVVVKMVRASV